MFSLELFAKIFICIITLILIFISLICSYTSPFFESNFKRQLKHSVPKIEQFSHSSIIDNNLLDLPQSPFTLHHLQEKSYEKLYFSSGKKASNSKDYDLILFVPGHKGSFSQIIQFQGYLYQKFKEFGLKSFYFKFFAIDYNQTPSAFSENLIETQAEYIQFCLKYLASQCIKKHQKITIIAHSMGGVATMLALNDLAYKNNIYIIRSLEKIVFLNSPLGQHPLNIDFNLQNSYSKIYLFFSKEKERKLLENLVFLSFSGNKGDIEVSGEISTLKIGNKDNYYHFFSNEVKGVYLHLSHVETLTNPFFLLKLSEFFIDSYVNKINSISFNFIWYFQHINRQFYKIGVKPINQTVDYYQNLKESLGFLENNQNFKNFPINSSFCREENMIFFGIFKESCLIISLSNKKIINLWIRAESGQENLRIVLYSQDSNNKMDKIVNVSPEFKLDVFFDYSYKFLYTIPYSLLNEPNVKLLIIKSQRDNASKYQIMSEILEAPEIIFFSELLLKKSKHFSHSIERFSVNYEFLVPFFVDPLFLTISIRFEAEQIDNNGIILIWKVKELNESSAHVNEISFISAKAEGDQINQEIFSAKYKSLQIIFPSSTNSTIDISFEISWFELAHYLGRNFKHAILSMIIPISLIVGMLQYMDVIKNIKNESFLKKMWRNFFWLIFFLGNWNIFYLQNVSEWVLNILGFFSGEKNEKYKIWTMIGLVPVATLTITILLNIIFRIFFEVNEIISLVFLKIFNKFKENQIYLLLVAIYSLGLAVLLMNNNKWIYFPISFLFVISLALYQKKCFKNYPYELSKTFFFITFLLYLMNINKILLIFEHSLREDEILSEFLSKDSDVIKFLALQVWGLMGACLTKITQRNVRIFFSAWFFFMIIIMLLLGSGKVYFIHYILTYSSLFLAVFIIHSFF